MGLRFIDVEGLSGAYGSEVAAALGIEGEPVTNRVDLLARLAHGAGVVVVTGPSGAIFWSHASREVTIRVEPDGYDYKERIADERLWSLRAVGVPAQEAKAVTDRTRKWREENLRAADLRARLAVARESTTPLLVEEFHVERLSPEEGAQWLADNDELAALDWEWDVVTHRELGFSAAGARRTLYCDLSERAQLENVLQRPTGLRGFVRRLHFDVPVVFHGGRADLGVIYPNDPIELMGKPIHDTMVMAYLADPDADDLGLKPLTRKYLGRNPMDFPGNLTDLPPDMVARYAGADARNTYDLFKALVPELLARGQWEVYDKIERPLVPLVASMEKYGSPVDPATLLRLYREHAAIEIALRTAIKCIYNFDIRDVAGKRAFVKSVTGYDPGSLDQRTLSKNPQGEIDLLLYHNRTRTRRNNFLKPAIKEWVRQGKPALLYLYPKFNQAGKENSDLTVGRAPRTGRFSSSGPNLQQQPIEIREMFIAPEGFDFFSFDYKSLEVYIAAAVSGDTVMLEALNSGVDLHSIFQQKIAEITGVSIPRLAAKIGNFEQLYGGREKQLQRILAKVRSFLTDEQAKALVRGHTLAFPRFHAWAQETIETVRERGYAETLFGRRRYVPELYSPDSELRMHGERAAVNTVIQGTAADVVKMIMLRLVPVMAKWNGHISLQVHDEVCGWIRSGQDTEAFKAEVKVVMQSIELPGVTLQVEGSVGRTWAEAH